MRPAIRIDSLSKSYRLGRRTEAGYRTLRESMTGPAAAVWRGLKQVGSRFLGKGRREAVASPGEFWALKDVSFEVQPGEVVGIIGRNGAGKSTLLKILSRITEPTSGRAEVRGRMGSLLEVGTGFHPELTGRENIYLNGSILGMSRREIARKFDEIVAFSEIEQFVDTPVKRYSSGMYVRLAFAVAAHLEPEILIVDEVLAVGDAQFQKKCLGKMQQVGREGRTILFVSHNMAAITSLCSSVAWVQQGQLHAKGNPGELVRGYLLGSAGDDDSGVRDLEAVPRQCGDQKVRFRQIRLSNSEGMTTGKFSVGEPICVTLRLESDISATGEVGYTLKTIEGMNLFTTSSNDSGALLRVQPSVFELRATMAPNYLRPGRYCIQVGTTWLTCRDLIAEAISFEVVADRHYCEGGLYSLPGSLFFPYTWELLSGVTSHAS
jgi:lipopolysaccharide transport system ATP-binding protein